MTDEDLQAEMDEAIGDLVRRAAALPVTPLTVGFLKALCKHMPQSLLEDAPNRNNSANTNHRILRFVERTKK